MPRRQPFTLLCQQAAKLARPVAADLHAHTTASDGDYTPSQLVAHARQAGLAAVAVTDHDTTAGLPEAVEAAGQFAHRPIRVVAGVEVTTEYAGRGFHVLGLFIDPNHPELSVRLAEVQAGRRERFYRLADWLTGNGVQLGAGAVERTAATASSLGRRHLASLLVSEGHVSTRNEAFRRWLGPASAAVPPAHRVRLTDAVRLITAAGGISSLAHPPADMTCSDFTALAAAGLNGVEVAFPAASVSRRRELRAWADELGLAATAGSDCHGPDHTARKIGAVGVTAEELDQLHRSAVGTSSHRS